MKSTGRILVALICMIAMLAMIHSQALGETAAKGDYQDVYEGISKEFGDPFSYSGMSLVPRTTFSGVLGGNFAEVDGLIVTSKDSSLIVILNPSEMPDSGWMWHKYASTDSFKKQVKIISEYATGYGLSDSDTCLYYAPMLTKVYAFQTGAEDAEQEHGFVTGSVNTLLAMVIKDVHPELVKWAEEEMGISFDIPEPRKAEESSAEQDETEDADDLEPAPGDEDAAEAPEATEEPAPEFEELSKGSKGEAVKQVQTRLNELGYNVGKADGSYGNKSKTAVEAFQRNNDLAVTGVVDGATYTALFSDDAVRADEGEDEGFSELVEFKSVMMKSVSEQINTAADLTTTANNRAILAALLSLEFKNQRPDFEIDYKLPIYVCKQGSIASLAIGGKQDYAVVIYQSSPLSTSYGILYGNNPSMVKAALKATNESVWQVKLSDYNKKLEAVNEQL